MSDDPREATAGEGGRRCCTNPDCCEFTDDLEHCGQPTEALYKCEACGESVLPSADRCLRTLHGALQAAREQLDEAREELQVAVREIASVEETLRSGRVTENIDKLYKHRDELRVYLDRVDIDVYLAHCGGRRARW